MPRRELRTSDIAQIVRWLEAYAAEGHPIDVETNHRLAATDNEIVFRVGDWDALTALMERDEAEAS